MGWFDDQIEFRKKHERELLSDSFENIARSVTGRKVRKSLLKAQSPAYVSRDDHGILRFDEAQPNIAEAPVVAFPRASENVHVLICAGRIVRQMKIRYRVKMAQFLSSEACRVPRGAQFYDSIRLFIYNTYRNIMSNFLIDNILYHKL